MSLQFAPLPGLTNAHLGKYWSTLPDEWAQVKDAPPLDQQTELFSDDAQWKDAALRLRFSQELQIRLMIQNTAHNRMMQVQNGRFIVNWLKTADESYPRYEAVRSYLVESAESFHNFLQTEGISQPRLNQWEITYLNHIPKGAVWSDSADWSFFRPLNAIQGVPSLTDPESLAFSSQFLIQKDQGRLHVDCRRVRRADETEVVALNLTARGPIQNVAPQPSASDWLAPALRGLDLGRRAIVHTFRSLMSIEANSYWGLKDADA